MTMRRFAAWLALVAAWDTAFAQERTMNTGAPGSLRTWPPSGKWIVELLRNDEGKLGCALVTGIRERGEFYLFGFRRSGQHWSVVLADRNASAVQADSVKVIVDGTQIGSYLVSTRSEKGGMTAVRADVPDPEVDRLSRILPLGAVFKLQTDNSTYTVSLEGMPMALGYAAQCLTEAGQMER